MVKRTIPSDNNQSDDTVFTLLESFSEEAFLMDTKGFIINSNTLFAAYYGMHPHECIGVNVYELMATVLKNPEIAAHRKEKVEEVLRTGKRTTFEDVRNNHLQRFSINPVRSQAGEITRLIIIIQDISEQDRLAVERKHYQPRFDFALKAAHAGVWEWNLKTNDLVWSNELWSLCGLEQSNEKPTIKLWASTLHPDDKEMAMQTLTTATSNKAELNIEYRVCHPDGTVHWLTSRGMPMHDIHRQVTRYIGTIIDITERKQTELALIESKKRMTFALEATNSGVWEWDVTSDKVTWTDNVWKLYGLEPNSKPSTHQLCESNIYPDDRDVIFEKVMAAASKEIEINVEYRVCHRDGSIHWLMCRGLPTYHADGRLKCYIGTVTDITSRKELLNDLVDSKTMLTQALESARAGVWEWSLNTGANIWSDETWRLYGLEKGSRTPSFELWMSTIHPDDRDTALHAVTKAADNESELNVEYRIYSPNGSLRWLMSRGKPLYDQFGKAERYIGTIIDITERKKIEEQYRKSREHLDFVLEKSHVGVWDFNLRDGTTVISFEHARIFGYETMPPVWSLQMFFDHIIPEDRDGIEAIIRNSIEKQNQYSFECRIHDAKGEVRWIWVAGAFKTGQYGESSHVVGVIRDITERKKAEQEIIEGKSKLEAALASMSDAVFISDIEANLKEFNAAYATFHRFRNQSECVKNLAEYPEIFDLFMHHGELVPVNGWPVSRALHGEIATNAEYTLHRKDTDETWTGSYSFAPIREQNGDITGSVIVVRDVTEQKLLQKTIRESELKFRTIFACSPVAIAIRDVLDGTLFDVNYSWERIFGYTKEEVIGRSVKELDIYLKSEDYEHNVTALHEHGQILNKPMQFRKKSGEIIHVLFSGELITYNDKACILVMITDITLQELQQLSIERLEQIVAERTGQLKEEVKRLNSFLHMISHEYRTPLAIIRGNLDLIELKNKHHNCVNPAEMTKIRRAIDRLVEVMEESMHENRFFKSRTELLLKPFQLAPVVSSQVESFLSLWPDRAMHYSATLGDNEIYGDSSQLKLAIFNLLDNARKYSPPGSTIELKCFQEGDEAVISIRNQGTQITKSEAVLLFEKYKRGSHSMNTGGAGLGLWMVKSIIDHHNGQVSLEGIASGVEARIRLPLFHQKG